MTEYWVSKKSYFCKYCDIYIRDDKPSRAQHENGLRHKGNLERYIREIYKKEDRAQKDKADETSQIAKINKAAQLAHEQNDLPSAGPSVSKHVTDGEEENDDGDDETERAKRVKRAKEDWKGSEDVNNYSDARSLGFINPEDEEVSRAQVEKQVRSQEGLIGSWEAVRKLPPATKLSDSIRSQVSGKMASKLNTERDPEKAPIRKLFSERKLDSEIDFLEGIEIKVKVDRRSQTRLKHEAEEPEARVIHGSLLPIRLDGLKPEDYLPSDDPATFQQPHSVQAGNDDDIKPKLEDVERPPIAPQAPPEPAVTFKKRKPTKAQSRQKT